ncbi:alpha/beta hydrolase [Halobacillus mangrovi]|uniref:alpha/beta hydrolase n=1 Tax=Halobacillus mangrovi TaxID=402384 RepID=UPI003D974E9C
MITPLIAKLLRVWPNQAEKRPMVPILPVKSKKELLIETSVKPTYITCYYPLGREEHSLPAYLNLHGGAFIMNSKEMDDPYCRKLANDTGSVVINIDYAKAPEYPFPKPIEQVYEIFQWIKERANELNIDPEKLMVGGQSSGGNIATALCLLLKERRQSQPILQVLAYPMLDFVTPHSEKPEPDPRRAKHPQVANFLNRCYVPEEGQARHPQASPVLAEELDELAPTLFVIPEYDAFTPEAEVYAENLKKAGNRVREVKFKNCYHAFTHLGPKEKAEEAWNLIAEEIRGVIS